MFTGSLERFTDTFLLELFTGTFEVHGHFFLKMFTGIFEIHGHFFDGFRGTCTFSYWYSRAHAKCSRTLLRKYSRALFWGSRGKKKHWFAGYFRYSRVEQTFLISERAQHYVRRIKRFGLKRLLRMVVTVNLWTSLRVLAYETIGVMIIFNRAGTSTALIHGLLIVCLQNVQCRVVVHTQGIVFCKSHHTSIIR